MIEIQSLLASSLTQSVFVRFLEYVMSPEDIEPRLARIVWITAIIILIIFTAILVFGFGFLLGFHKTGITITVLLWALFLGGTALMFLSQKMITTVFGSLLGIGTSDIGTGAGLITAVNKQVTDISVQLHFLASDSPTIPDSFVTGMVWLFFTVVFLLCLPAFFIDK